MKNTIAEIIKSILIGVLSLYIINMIGQFLNFNIPINVLTIILLGFFRIPGFLFVLLIIML